MATVSTKHLQLDKANKAMVIAAGISVFVFVTGSFLSWAIVKRYRHQENVISAKSAALEQLEKNIEAKNAIVSSYRVFTDGGVQDNIIGGSVANGSDIRGGDNARLILDALPSRYDFPALATSVQYLVTANGYSIEGITGIDDEVAQLDQEISAQPVPVEIPLNIVIPKTDYFTSKEVVRLFERSIRPFKINNLSITGSGSDIEVSMDVVTYYQPAKSFVIGEKVIR